MSGSGRGADGLAGRLVSVTSMSRRSGWPAIAMRRGRRCGGAGIVSVSTPLSNDAWIASGSVPSGSVKLRSKRPWMRSRRTQEPSWTSVVSDRSPPSVSTPSDTSISTSAGSTPGSSALTTSAPSSARWASMGGTNAARCISLATPARPSSVATSRCNADTSPQGSQRMTAMTVLTS